MMKTFLSLLRPEQWIKNLFLFVPLIFSKRLFDTSSFVGVLIGFALFSAASSSAYIFNDIRDMASDLQHPRKRFRPIASGKISLPFAMSLFVVSGMTSIIVSYSINHVFGLIVLSYIVLNVAYSLFLKHIVILDVMVIAAFFLLRVMAGASIVDIYPSSWLIVCTIFLALFLGFSKRRHEILILSDNANAHRKVLEHYSPPYFLDQMIGIVTACTVVSYMLYTVSEETVRFFGTRQLIWTVPFVLYGIFRYLYLVHIKEEGGDPAGILLRDKPLLVNILLWSVSCIIIVY